MTGTELKTLLKNKKLNQIEAAQLLGISRQTMNVWCKSEKLTEDVVYKINRKLNGKSFDTKDQNLSSAYDEILKDLRLLVKTQNDTIEIMRESLKIKDEKIEELTAKLVTTEKKIK